MIKWSVTHKRITALFCMIIMAVGAFSYYSSERQENPSIESPICSVTCVYPGASPEDVEKQVLKPLEDEVNTISDIKTLESYAMNSVGIIKITLEDMSDDDIEKKWTEVKDKVDNAKGELPESAYEPEIETDFTSSYGLILGLSSDEYSYEDIKTAADSLKSSLEKVEGVKEVAIEGNISQQVEIDLDMTKLQSYGISPQTAATVLKARNINIPGGNLELEKIQIPVQITGEYNDISEIENTIISVSKETGTPVYLKDLAEIKLTYEDKEETAYVNGEKALFVCVKYMDGLNILKIEKKLQKVISDFKVNGLYADMNMTELYNQAQFVNESISLFNENLISAIILVLIVVFISMGIRSALIVAFPIPIVICIVFTYMKATEIPIHQVSIAALIICLSLLVANGIVSNDNMNVYLDRGENIMTACTKGIKEVNIPILTSTLTTVASFLPLAMMQGSAGKFVNSLPILVTVALLGSYITSITVVPAMGYIFLDPKKIKRNEKMKAQKEKFKKLFRLDKGKGAFSNFYMKVLDISLRNPRKVLALFLAMLIATSTIVPTMLIQLFPPVEREQYVLNVTLQDGATVEKTEDACLKVSEVLKNESSIDNFSYKVGNGYTKYYVSFMPNNIATNKAQFLINGTRSEAENVERDIINNVPGISTQIKYLEINLPTDYPVQVRITGTDINELRRMAEEIQEIGYTVEGTKNIENNFGYDSYKLDVDINEEKASMVGLSAYDIASTVRMAVNGVEISELKQKDINKESLPIVAKVSSDKKTSADMLDTLFLTSQITGDNIPLSQVADIDTETSLNKIVRRGGERTITIGSFVKDGYNTRNVMKAYEEALKDYKLPDGYTMEFGGENETSNDAFSSMKLPAVIAVVLIYIILVFQFGDLREPLIIMATIPLSFIGIIIGLKVMGYPIGFMALLGAISLMGVVVNNGIVLLDYMKLVLKDEKDVIKGIKFACETRLRPIMVGMITTVISLIPLMISGGALWAPMATSIVFGMILSSVLTMTAIPCAFIILHNRRLKKGKFRFS